MKITKDLLPAGQGVRTGKKLTKCLGLVVHWIGVAQGRAEVIRGNFARSECGTHYISDWHDGHIIQCVPEDEVCYHVGGTRYTDLKKRLCGSANPNWYFVGVECCIDPKTVIPGDYGAPGKYMELGKPSDKQYEGLVALAADFLTRHGMTTENLYRHYDITGKVCHAWFVKEEGRWERFKADVGRKMKGEIEMTREEVEAILEGAKPRVYTDMAQVPAWAQGLVKRAVEGGVIRGDGGGKLNLTDTDLKTLSMLDNAGLLKGGEV